MDDAGIIQEPSDPPTKKPTTVKFFTPTHVACPGRPHEAPPALFYIVEGSTPQISACEACAMLVQLSVRELELEAPLKELAAAAEAEVTRPAAEIGPRALFYDPLAQTYRIGGGERCIGRIGCEVNAAAAPSRAEPLTTWGVAQHPSAQLSLDERLAISAFMAGRWWAWAHAPGHEERIQKPGPSRIVRPH